MEFILTAQAAAIIGITPNHVRVLQRRGELPAERTVNGVRLFDLDVVRRYAQARAQRRQQRSELVSAAA